jgi:hypothetical protein
LHQYAAKPTSNWNAESSNIPADARISDKAKTATDTLKAETQSSRDQLKTEAANARDHANAAADRFKGKADAARDNASSQWQEMLGATVSACSPASRCHCAARQLIVAARRAPAWAAPTAAAVPAAPPPTTATSYL